MTRIVNEERAGPGTHALVIGVGGDVDPRHVGLGAAYEGALQVVRWLQTDYRNPTAELASLELLASRPGEMLAGSYTPAAYKANSDFPYEQLFLGQPSRSSVRDAFLQWRERCNSDPDNIALLYFAGPGGPAAMDTGLVLHDEAPLSARTISFFSILSAMQSCVADRQVYFLDIQKTGVMSTTPEPLVLAGVPARLPGRRAIIYAPAPSPGHYAGPTGPTYFAGALVRALANARPGSNYDAVSLTLLTAMIRGELRNSPTKDPFEHVRSDITNDFDLHFPSTASSARPAAAVETAPPEIPEPVLDPPQDDGDAPLIDLNHALIKPLLERARKRGYITYDEFAEAFLPDRLSTDQIEDVMHALHEMGVNVVEPEEADEGSDKPDEPAVDLAAGEGGGAVPAFLLDDHRLDGGEKEPEAGAVPTADRPQADPPATDTPTARRTRRGTAKEAGGDPARPARRARTKKPPGPPPPPPPPPPPGDESNTDFVPDDAETERDELARSVLAIGLARRLHRIWRTANEKEAPLGVDDQRAAFVVHLDAPWGGGKTTFANFIARVLNPLAGGRGPADFLSDRYGKTDLGGIFLDDPPSGTAAALKLAKLSPHSRRPWIVVSFNAWQAEHCAPPWWVFYEAVRKQCFRAIFREGDLAWRPSPPSSADGWKARLKRLGNRLLARARGLDRWPVLVAREYAWRARNPKILSLFATAAFGGLMLLLLYRLGAWGAVEAKGATTAGFVLTSGLGLLAAGLTGVSGLWALGALFTESMVPGTTGVAERVSLGTGDPFERFRRHFHRTMVDLRRPVMVIIDDLDRCRPDFVVDLVRGMQTLLRSPRVVFVILGDRDWIERAFEAHHKAMEKVDVGPEQTFGARFVEKAIQMSFILPAMEEEGRLAYSRRVLLGPRADSKAEPEPAVDAETAKTVREVVRRETSSEGADPFNAEAIFDKALAEIAPRPDAARGRAFAEQIKREVNDTMAINAATSSTVEHGVVHQLEALVPHFPANPRQIKRIVNAVTIYYAAALQRRDIEPGPEFRIQLALWVVLMTEWPETWRLIASFPELIGLVQSEDLDEALAAAGTRLPGSAAAVRKAVERILADPALTALVRGSAGPPLDSRFVPDLARLTPLNSRKRRLEEEKAGRPGGNEEAPRDST